MQMDQLDAAVIAERLRAFGMDAHEETGRGLDATDKIKYRIVIRDLVNKKRVWSFYPTFGRWKVIEEGNGDSKTYTVEVPSGGKTKDIAFGIFRWMAKRLVDLAVSDEELWAMPFRERLEKKEEMNKV